MANQIVASLSQRSTRLRWWFGTRAFVLLLALGMLLQHDWKHLFDDLEVYQRWGLGLAQGEVPADDPMWQYPPLAAFVFAGIGLLGAHPWMFALLFVAVDIAISLLLSADATRRGRWHGFAMWLAAPILIGPIFYGRYDVVPTLFALAGLLAVAVPLAAGAVLAVGGALKIWPAVLAVALAQRDWIRGAFGGAITGIIVLVVSAWAFPSVIAGFLSNGEARGLQTESVAALPFVWARFAFGADVAPEIFRYGSSEVGHPFADLIAHWLVPLTVIGLLVLIVARLLGRLDNAPVADIAFVIILWLMITSRVLSPQYNVWLVGMAALVWAAGSTAMQRATIPVIVTALAAQALYPFSYIDIIEGAAIGTTVHTVRIFALLAALWLAVRALVTREPSDLGASSGAEIVPQTSAGRQ